MSKTSTIKKDPLTFKQRAFVDEYLSNGGNATKAAKVAYNVTTQQSAEVVGSKNLSNAKVAKILEKERRSMREIFDEMGATDEFVASVFTEGAKNAKKYYFKGDKLAAVPDLAERRQNAKEIASIKELYPNQKVDINANISTESAPLQQIADLLQTMYDERRQRTESDARRDTDNKNAPVQSIS